MVTLFPQTFWSRLVSVISASLPRPGRLMIDPRCWVNKGAYVHVFAIECCLCVCLWWVQVFMCASECLQSCVWLGLASRCIRWWWRVGLLSMTVCVCIQDKCMSAWVCLWQCICDFWWGGCPFVFSDRFWVAISRQFQWQGCCMSDSICVWPVHACLLLWYCLSRWLCHISACVPLSNACVSLEPLCIFLWQTLGLSFLGEYISDGVFVINCQYIRAFLSPHGNVGLCECQVPVFL